MATNGTIRFPEIATPDTPPTDQHRIYVGTDGSLKKIDDTGSIVTYGSGGSSPLTTKGDLYARNASADTRLAVGTNGQVLAANSSTATGLEWTTVAGTGDVVGPSSATNNAMVLFDGTTGKLIKNSTVTVSTSGVIAGASIDADTNTLTNIEDADIKAGANIALSKLLAVTASRALASNAAGQVSAATTTLTELNYLSGVTSAVQTQLDGKQTLDATLTALAAYSTNGLVTQTAADTFTGRTITGTTDLISVTNGNGVSGNPTITVGANVYTVGGTDVAIADGGTGQSTALAAFNALATAVLVTKGDLTASNGTSAVNFALGTNSQVLSVNTATATGLEWRTLGAGSSPLTTKGDIYTYSTTDDRLGVGSNGQVLAANSSTATGLEWKTVSGTGDVTAASAFGTDNVLIKSDGTGKGVQATGISVDDFNNVTAVNAINSVSHIINGISANFALATNATNHVTASSTTLVELNYLSGTTSAVQTQLNNKQPLDGDLTALAALSSNGIVVRNTTDSFVVRTLTGPAAGLSVTNGDGISGNPTLALANDLSALEGLSSTGLAARTASDTWSVRTITGTGNNVTVTNGDGVSGNPTINIGSDVVTLTAAQNLTSKTISGAVGHGTWTASGTWTLPAFTAGGDVQMAENVSVLLDASLSADGSYSGICMSGTAGATLAFGDLVYLSAADSRWELADADAEATAGNVKIAICVLAAAADGDATRLLTYGKIRADANFPTFTVGGPVYVSTTPGDLQTTQPSGTDDVIRVVGHALTTDELFFNPSNDYITHT